MLTVNPEELEIVLGSYLRNEKVEKDALINEILSYKKLNDIVVKYGKLPSINQFKNHKAIFSQMPKWTWEPIQLHSKSLEELKGMVKHAEAWEKFISQWMEHQKGTEK